VIDLKENPHRAETQIDVIQPRQVAPIHYQPPVFRERMRVLWLPAPPPGGEPTAD
jgi:hypothetical protein